MAQSDADYPPLWQARLMLAALTLAYVISFVDRQILALMVGPIRRDLGINDLQIGLLQGFAFSLFYCLMGLPIGWAADRLNRKRLIAIGIGLWSFATIACGLASSFGQLFMARMAVGFGEAALLPAGISILVDMFAPDRQVRAISIFMLGGLLGAGGAFIVGGGVIGLVEGGAVRLPLLDHLAPWQQIFIMVGVPGLLLAALVLLLREPARLGKVSNDRMPLSAALNLIWRQRDSLMPYFIVTALLAVVSFGGQMWFATHVMRAFGFSAGEAGLLLGAMLLTFGVAGNFIGIALTERFTRSGRYLPHLLTVLVAALLCIAGVPALLSTNVILAIALWAIALIGQSGFYGSVMGGIQGQLPNDVRATAAAMTMIVMTLLGMAGGASVVGWVADTYFAGQPRGIGLALAIVTTPCIVIAAATVFWARGRHLPLGLGHPARERVA